ncbi:TetR/AcrR family transcriptional regulator [Thalassotalea sp. ND16A]|uniref:TetR/AcrR family transcriptional regulator n=1 Tax=Thalassotalea sp. ND16A TaxID=1535422 RepID=UPI000519F2F1
MNWQRARTDEKKNERKEAIFKAAFALFKKRGYDNVSFNSIAAEAGYCSGTAILSGIFSHSNLPSIKYEPFVNSIAGLP